MDKTDTGSAVRLNQRQSDALDKFQVRLIAHLGHTVTRGGSVAWAIGRGIEYIEDAASKV